jgi:hypothetical protein
MELLFCPRGFDPHKGQKDFAPPNFFLHINISLPNTYRFVYLICWIEFLFFIRKIRQKLKNSSKIENFSKNENSSN